MISSRNLAGTIVQRGGLEKATLVPELFLQRWRSGHAGRAFIPRQARDLFAKCAGRALVRRIAAA